VEAASHPSLRHSRQAPARLALILLPLALILGPASPAIAVRVGQRDAKPTQPVYILRDNGVRCFAAPCFSWDLIDVSSGEARQVSGVDLSKLALSPDEEQRVRALLAAGGLYVSGYTTTHRIPSTNAEGVTFTVVEIVGPTTESPSGIATPVVPELSPFWLLGSGLLVLTWLGLQKQRRP
jgi:hypothetical protein